MAGTGHEIIAPEALVELRPELVVVMNPIYRDEIAAELARLGVDAEIDAV
jgi:ABC-type hemin transport system substrate-binding protein